MDGMNMPDLLLMEYPLDGCLEIKNKNMKILKKLILVVALIVATLTMGCEKTPECELNNTGDVTFIDDGPSYAWDGCYIEVDWANGSYTSVTFYNSKSYYDKPAGRADVYMEWEDATAYYYSYGYITLQQCSHVDAYCTWSKKKSAEVSSFTLVRDGQVLKSEVSSIEEYRKTLK